jgi:hypothetical protein
MNASSAMAMTAALALATLVALPPTLTSWIGNAGLRGTHELLAARQSRSSAVQSAACGQEGAFQGAVQGAVVGGSKREASIREASRQESIPHPRGQR